jgi:hypothetical protein
VPPNELKFWQMIQDLLKLSQVQSEALFERMWVLDLQTQGRVDWIPK